MRSQLPIKNRQLEKSPNQRLGQEEKEDTKEITTPETVSSPSTQKEETECVLQQPDSSETRKEKGAQEEEFVLVHGKYYRASPWIQVQGSQD